MAEIHTEIEITAPAERVWQIFQDFDRYADWNPYMRSIGGTAEPGRRLTVRAEPEGGRAMRFRPTVLSVDPNRQLVWRGHLLFPLLFSGRHLFRIDPLNGDRVRFTQSERFSGVLVWLVLRLVGAQTKRGFEAMNQALKQRAEASGA